MTFVNAAILLLLPLGLIPIVIYYLMRFRSLQVTWGANYVLELALERLRKKLYWQQIVLLALRVLAVVAIVIVFARPASTGSASTVTGSGLHHVVVLDGSYSMLAEEAGVSRWDRAKAALGELVQSWGRGETWSLVVLGDEPQWVVDGQTINDPAAAVAVLDSLETVEASASVAPALEQVAQKLGDTPFDLYIFADDQANTWQGAEQIALGSDESLDAAAVAQGVSAYWLNPPLAERSNLAITAVQPAHERALIGHPTSVYITIRNFGSTPANDAAVQLLIDGAFFDSQTLSLLPGQETQIAFDLTLDEPGSHAITARLADDTLPYDNAMSAGLVTTDRLNVLVLRDPQRRGKFDSAWGFLETLSRVEDMVDDDGNPIFDMGPVRFTLHEGPIGDAPLGETDVVLVDGGKPVTAELAGALGQYVEQGGGLILAADDGVDARMWNEHLGSAGLLPARLSRANVEQLGGERYATLSRAQFDAPALRIFADETHGDVSNAKFFTWYHLSEPHDRATVLARFGDLEPFAVRHRRDLGNVVLLAAGLNARGNNLVVREFFAPMLFGLVAEAAAGRIHRRTVARDEPIRLRLPTDEPLRGLTFNAADPNVEPRALTPIAQADGSTLASVEGGADTTGLYSILAIEADGSTSRHYFGVQGQRIDSDLAALDDRQRTAITSRLNLAQVTDWRELDELLKANRRGADWHHWVILGLLAFLVGEMLLQRKFVTG